MHAGAFNEDTWGHQYGGCDYRDASEGSPSCDDLPQYPQDPVQMWDNQDDLQEMCK